MWPLDETPARRHRRGPRMRSPRKLPSVVPSRYNFPGDRHEPSHAARAFDAGSRDPLRSNLIGAGHRSTLQAKPAHASRVRLLYPLPHDDHDDEPARARGRPVASPTGCGRSDAARPEDEPANAPHGPANAEPASEEDGERTTERTRDARPR